MRSSTRLLKILSIASLLSVMAGYSSWAQNTASPATDWGGNYTFSSPAEKNLRLLQADLIEKRNHGYYESIGHNTINQTITNNTTNNIGQNTNAIGAVNNSTTNIDVNGSNNNIDISNVADSTGCQDGSVNIGEGASNIGSSGCP